MSAATSTSNLVRRNLLAKKWIGFDLDDTLHEFRKASRAATTHCLTLVANKYRHVSLQTLQLRYQQVLREGTTNAFVDGKTSHDYRRARFAATLDHFAIDHDLVDHLLDEYEHILTANLVLKPGASLLLQAIKTSGRKIIVITEGPQDAQERTVRGLGISQHLDLLVTTNYFGVSKTSGLFRKVLVHLGIESHDIVYIGDSWERDIVPAKAEGIDAIWLNEQNEARADMNIPTIGSLMALENIFLDHDST